MQMAVVVLGEVAEIERRVVPADSIADGTTYVGLEHMIQGGGLGQVPTVTAGELASAKFAFTPEHVLYGKLRPNLSKVARPAFAGVCSTDILPIRPGCRLDRNYLGQFLLSPDSVRFATERMAGANLPRISPELLATLPIPLPALAEQRRIAAILDRAEAVRTLRAYSIGHCDDAAAATFLRVFGPAHVWPTRWTMRPFEAALSDETARSPKLQQSGYLAAGRFPVIDQGKSDVAGFCDDEEQLCRSRLPVVLFGDHTRVVKLIDHPFVVGADGAKVLSPQQGLTATFAAWVLRQLPIPDLGYSRHMREVKRFNFPAPPMELQQQFERELEAISSIKARYRAHLAKLDELFASLQYRAFRGEL